MTTTYNFADRPVLILGSGYVGNAVGQALASVGARVTTLTRNSERAQEASAFAEKVVQCDLDASDWHDQVDLRQDFVLNCVSSAGNGMDGYRKSYLGGMESIITWARRATVGTFVYTSATSVYPQSDGELVTEIDVPAELSASGGLLRESEQLAQSATGCWDRAFILRLGAIYGPTRHHLLDALKRGETTFAGSGDFILNYIHCEDIVAAILAAFASADSSGGVFNVVDGAYPTKREVVEWLAEQVSAEKPVFDPNAATRRGAARTNATGSLPHRRVSNERLRSELGWAPIYTDYRAGYAALI
ncbi:NAD-dependent epimerase/dehydratase family protein [Cerasicoccus arenae]|uniref:NAD(P)-dependent oxidoreductase n=1 Tax=Cerasicoccus arenae TaxID=424488 RepID=A0A8J3DC48_9BACT|nr:NAD-dependent epimerase/dehydratase family protein [Cerasicoccus arenae]MBK1859549.1 NAD-dependent epimerase/dehydratase family protein [Cerasicoccus arenae]GHC03199.1 NAD(P)-dependent oxidoreductase [Cerasicoccus arenae]